MNQNFDKRLKYLDREVYDRLSPQFKEKKSEYHILSREIRKLLKEKTKLQNRLDEVRNELRIKGKIQTKQYNELRSIVNRENPTFSVTIDKENGPYVYCNIKLGTQKTVYIGTINNVRKKFSKYQPKIDTNNEVKFKFYLSILLEKILYDLIDFRVDNWNQHKVTSKDILNDLEDKFSSKNEEKVGWFNW
jgi:hypothetical protein